MRTHFRLFILRTDWFCSAKKMATVIIKVKYKENIKHIFINESEINIEKFLEIGNFEHNIYNLMYLNVINTYIFTKISKYFSIRKIRNQWRPQSFDRTEGQY